MRRLLAALVARIPAPTCCPHKDLDDDPDAVPTDTTHADYEPESAPRTRERTTGTTIARAVLGEASP